MQQPHSQHTKPMYCDLCRRRLHEWLPQGRIAPRTGRRSCAECLNALAQIPPTYHKHEAYRLDQP